MKTLQEKLQNPEMKFWPQFRWNMTGAFHTDETIRKNIQMFYDSGIGGAEIVAMPDPGIDDKIYGWATEEWIHDTNLVLEETAKRGMAASLTCGAHWSNANLITITPDDKAASQEIEYTSILLKKGETFSGPLKRCEIFAPNVHKLTLAAVVAARRIGTRDDHILLDENSLIVLTDQVDNETLTFTAPEDDYELFAFWIHGTGQTAEPAPKPCYAINYIDKYGAYAWIDYWDKEVLTESVKTLSRQNKNLQIYMDSIEVITYGNIGLLWGLDLLDEFKARRNYDMAPFLPFIILRCGPGGGGRLGSKLFFIYEGKEDTLIGKVRNDLFQTMTECYMENLLKPIQDYLHTFEMGLRSEISYGVTFEISQPGKYVDGIETESLEFAAQIDSYRNLAGPAHIYHKEYSCEMGASLLNYKMPLNFYTQMIYTQMAAGVTRTMLQSYSSEEGPDATTSWPGHEAMYPIFSDRFGPRQPASIHYKDWTTMLARYQMLLSQGRPRMDLAILRLDYNFNNMWMIIDERTEYASKWMRANEGIYWKDTSLQNAGYTYDYFAPQLLEDITYEDGTIAPDGPGYQALILYQEALPLPAAKRILAWAKQGLPVVLVNNATEMTNMYHYTTHGRAAGQTPYHDGLDEELRKVIRELLCLPNTTAVDTQEDTQKALEKLHVYPRAKFVEPSRNFLSCMREDDTYKYLYVYNCMYAETQAASVEISLEGTGQPYQADCWNGRLTAMGHYRQENGRTIVSCTLAPGDNTMFVLKKNAVPSLHVTETNAYTAEVIDGELVLITASNGDCSASLSDGRTIRVSAQVPETIPLRDWTLIIEDWNEGDKTMIREDRGLGYVTEEVFYETKKTKLEVGKVALVPWSDIEAVGPAVSGVGYYTTAFTLPSDWDDNCRAFLSLGSVNGSTLRVSVNGQQALLADYCNPRTDITDLVHAGSNELLITVTSSLNNRLKQREYYTTVLPQCVDFVIGTGTGGGEMTEVPESVRAYYAKTFISQVEPYGLTGDAQITFYKLTSIK